MHGTLPNPSQFRGREGQQQTDIPPKKKVENNRDNNLHWHDDERTIMISQPSARPPDYSRGITIQFRKFA